MIAFPSGRSNAVDVKNPPPAPRFDAGDIREYPWRTMRIAVVIPCYDVAGSILPLLKRIGPEVSDVFVVDDACPAGTGDAVQAGCRDSRVRVIRHARNHGVGGAVMTGYKAALAAGAEVLVKLDGDGQMDPALIPRLVRPVLEGRADYVKADRFHSLASLSAMPALRLAGNSLLSFVNKLVSGYWNVMDPTNGFTALHVAAVREIPWDKVDAGYFFESDVLFRLGLARAVVEQVPMDARYAGEKSHLSALKAAVTFPPKYAVRFLKRVFYNYVLRDFNPGSVGLLLGTPLFLGGAAFGAWRWARGLELGTAAPAGTVMLAGLPVMLGAVLLLSALLFDVLNVPKRPLQSHRP
jgi:dolichol-phosphate mannosyltransferase